MKTVLVVDDEKKIRKSYSRFFTKQGFKVMTAFDAVNARDILKNEAIDIMLLDINMPVVNGDVLHDVALSFHKDTKVIVCSVYPVDERKELVKEADGYFDKSDDISELKNKVNDILEECHPEKGEKILVVDDSLKIKDVFCKLLKKEGYSPIPMESSLKALEYSKKHKEEIDLILLDIAMPKCDGMDFFEIIKSIDPQIKIIITSVFCEDEQKSLIFDADDYHDKSGGNEILIEKINRLLQKK